MTPAEPMHLVVIGAGMVAHRLVESLRGRDADRRWRVTVLGDEGRRPYDRIALSTVVDGGDPDALQLGAPLLWSDPRIELRADDAAVAIDRDEHVVRTRSGARIPYDRVVLATGSTARRPTVPGTDLRGVFVVRTVDDALALRAWVEERRARLGTVRGAVLGGGLLGLEAAGSLRSMGVLTSVVQSSGRLMSAQLDEGGAAVLRRLIEQRGIRVLTERRTRALSGTPSGEVGGLVFADGERLDADVVVIAVGIEPRDELAVAAGLAIGPAGGVVIDEGCATSDPRISAVGEVAFIAGACHGLVAPGYAMAEVLVDRLLGGPATVPEADTATRLKLSGVDVASFGDAGGISPGALEVVYADPVAGVYQKLVMSDDARVLLGGILVGDASAYASLRPMLGRQLGADPAAYLGPAGGTASSGELPDDAVACSCNSVGVGAVRAAVTDHGCTDLAGVKACSSAGTSCGSCIPLVKKIMTTELARAGVETSTALCEHVALSRPQLFEAVRIGRLTSFSEVIAKHGTGRGCDICKPAIASILSSLHGGHPLDGEHSTLQDTNDHVMANLQKDGSYSVVPRIPAGEITPEGLLAIGEVARDFGLYTKITGAQRIDLFGARLEQLPDIWRRLVDAGFESGHAYGKSLRAVKSCVGSTWCRYGVQDSVRLAIELELRYRGLRSPHKLKMGVSGCARECAEARGKDIGVIATEKGWNLYVGGNGGFTPRHATLFAEDLDTETLVRTIDRILIYYIRSADRLQRTASWLEEVEGGVEAVRAIVVDDVLGLGAELDAAIAEHLERYEDEWRTTLDDPQKLERFASFINAPREPDPSLGYVAERGQGRPARQDERDAVARGDSAVLIAGTMLEVRR
ncbi:nitrite reductase large subunit NirB [Microcella alkalica]|uniref:assimilatory sulfite reductase (ferredoxin) n=1 Tax=Microcella alkalica TaxID=355930 RepID=A0A839E9K3_9MICO|nr:nitrite reductase large subunit NirB [Microcella alkalica]MBA8847122.1 nitrite reductase (NADH) large subunit [Microcella alkalica]